MHLPLFRHGFLWHGCWKKVKKKLRTQQYSLQTAVIPGKSLLKTIEFYKIKSTWHILEVLVSESEPLWKKDIVNWTTLVSMLKMNHSSGHKRGKKKNIWVFDGNRSHDLPNTGWALYPLKYGELTESKAIYQTHIWHAYCILPGSSLSIAHCMVISK